jgi:hypothetical protein
MSELDLAERVKTLTDELQELKELTQDQKDYIEDLGEHNTKLCIEIVGLKRQIDALQAGLA